MGIHKAQPCASQRLVSSVLLLLVTSIAPLAAPADDTLYNLTTIDDPDAEEGTTARGINNQGDIVGDYYLSGDNINGFLYQSGTFTDIIYPYPGTFDLEWTDAEGINGSGSIVGYAEWYTDETHQGYGPFIYSGGAFTTFLSGNDVQFLAINNFNQIVGFGVPPGDVDSNGYTYFGGTLTPVSYPGSSGTFLSGINDAGLAVGSYLDGSLLEHPLTYAGGAFTTFNLPSNCDFTSINNVGQILGNCNNDDPFLYQNNTFTDGILPSGYLAFAINDNGQIVGEDGDGNGFLATPSDAQNPKTQGAPCDCEGAEGVGEPINVGTGNVYHATTDYQTTGQNKLSFTRYYNSMVNAPTFGLFMGMNWRDTYDRYIRILSPTSVMVERADGRQLSFTQSGGVWSTDTDVDLHLTNSGSSWTLTDSSDTVESYTTFGTTSEALLNSITARDGYTQTLTYAGTQLQQVKDSYNRTLGFAYNASGLIQTVTTPDALVLTYGYTTVTGGIQLTSVSYSTSPVTSITYHYGEHSSPLSALTSIIDENGATYAQWTYDGLSRGLTSQLGVGAGLVTMTYNDDGTVTVTNAGGVEDTYTFTTLQNVPKMTGISRAATSNTAAATRSFGYDSNGYLNSSTDWDGNLTTYVNDARGQPTLIKEAVGSPVARSTGITYDTTTPNTTYPYHLPVKIVTQGVTTAFNYDASGDLLTKVLTDTTPVSRTVPYVTHGQTRTWTYTWLNFLLQSVQTPRTDVTNKTTFTYDATGALTQISNALSQKTKITSHTGGGLPLTIVDPDNVTTSITYDPRNYLLTSTLVTTSGNLVTQYGYDKAENLTSVTLPDNSELTNGYDTAHRLTSVTDLFDNEIEYTLDAFGDRLFIDTYNPSDVMTRQHSGEFDNLGRTLEDIGGEDQTTIFTYDPQSNTKSIEDPDTNLTTQTFDALNRLSTVTDPSPGGTTTTTYDQHDRPLTVTAPNGALTSYVYDGFGDVIQQTSADSGVTVYYYDADSDLTQKTDATGAVTNNTYDALDRVLTTAYPADASENVAYTYDQTGAHGYGIGRLTSLTDAAGTLSRFYNQRGLITNETRVISGTTLSTGYAYDPANRVSGIGYPSGGTAGYVRDIMGRITSVTSKAPGAGSAVNVATGITYEPFGPVTAMSFGNSVTEARSYDLDYRLLTLVDTGSSSTLQSLTYGYDAANNVKTVTDGVNAANDQTLGYDSHNRLHTAAGNYGSLSYSYDTSGNRMGQTVAPAVTYSYTPDTNILTSITFAGTTQAIGVTAAGNVNSFSPAIASGVTSLTYNQANRLATALAGTSTVGSYLYDAFGQRLSKTASSVTTLFQSDQSGHLLEEWNTATGPQADYLYLGDMPLATLTPSTAALNYLNDDTLGTPQLATTSTQATSWKTTYQPFGKTAAIIGSLIQNLRLPGQYADAETGFSHNGFRDYMPNWGRYLEVDPIGLQGGINTYGYGYQNPAVYTDRLGLDTLLIVGGPTSHNPFGHVAVATTGSGIYSFGTGTTLGSDVNDYLEDQAEYRDSTAYIIDTTPDQEAAITNYLSSLPDNLPAVPGPDSSDTCASRSNMALSKGGLSPPDPFANTPYADPYTQNAISPLPSDSSSLGNYYVGKLGGSTITIPQGTSPNPALFNQFNPY